MYLKLGFSYLLITIFLGVFLRLFPFISSEFLEYKNWVHTHSHLGILGGLFMLLIGFLIKIFHLDFYGKKNKILFILTQLSILGMLFSFPFQGYGVWSIAFSSLFIFCSYGYAWLLLNKLAKNHKIENYFAIFSLICLIISSFGVWFLPVSIVKWGKYSEIYNACIYFFLHFQYNGFILSSLMALIMKNLKNKTISEEKTSENTPFKHSKLIFLWFCFGVLGSVFLSFTELFNQNWHYFLGGLSSFLLFLSLILISKEISKHFIKTPVLLKIFLLMFLFKTFLMFLSSFKIISEKIFFNKDIILAYLHFIFLGLIPCGVAYLLAERFNIKLKKWALIFYLSAFISTEIILIYKGLAVVFGLGITENYLLILFICSFLFLIPAGFLLKFLLKNKFLNF